jgi:hypothetical protein
MGVKSGGGTLKADNLWRLATVLAANVIVLNAALAYGQLEIGSLELATAQWKHLWAQIGSVTLATVIVVALNGLFSPTAKFRLVFWRWRFPLPGCRAFSAHLKIDPRIDFHLIEAKFGAVPNEPLAQNALWYRIYSSVESMPVVRSVHRDFLFCRDYTALNAIFLILFGALIVMGEVTTSLRWTYFALLALQYVVTAIAARNYGTRLVTSAVAAWQRQTVGAHA